MKHKRMLPRASVASLIAILSALSSQAAVLYWDVNGDASGLGGTGTWDTTTANWNVLAGTGTPFAWNNTTNQADFADFRGVGGTVTVDAGGVRAARLEFNAGAYALSGGPIALTSTTLLNIGAASGNVSLDGDLRIDTTAFTGDQALALQTASSGTLTISGDIDFDYTGGSATGIKTISLRGNHADSLIVFDGTVVGPVGGTASARLQLSGVSSARYEINGDNSALTNGTGGQIVRGTALLGHAKAFGNNALQIGVSSTVASDTAAVLTNGALTIANNISVGGANAASQLIVGGATAENSAFTGTMGGGTGAQNMRFSAVAGGRVDFSGSLTGSGSGLFIKQGAGVVAFTRAIGNTYTRGTEVQDGVLVLANTSGSATGTTNTLTIAAGAGLAGSGFSSSAIIASGATSRFSAGDMTKGGVSSLGTLTLSGGFTAASGATFDFDINGASSDLVSFGAGAVDIDGVVTVNFTSLGTVLTDTTYTLFTGSGDWSSVSSTFVFEAPEGYSLSSTYGAGAGYIFDATGHSLTVQFVSAIPEPSAFALFGGIAALGLAAVRRRKLRTAGVAV